VYASRPSHAYGKVPLARTCTFEGEEPVSTSRPPTRQTPTWVTALLVVIGLLIIVVAVVYFAEPAHKLPSFFPGHTPHGKRARVKHGVAALVVGLLVLVAAWFSAGRKRTT
jgi:hypothetical protein